MKKIKHPVSLIFLFFLVLLAGTSRYPGLIHSSAYASVHDIKNNTVKAGDNTSHIEETFESPDPVTPDTVYEKRVSVTNDTDTSCYVRVFVEKSRSDLPVSIAFDTKNWTEKQEDGYYYYRTALKGKKKTKPLFTHVATGKTESPFQILIYEETVQACGYQNAREAFASIGGEEESER